MKYINVILLIGGLVLICACSEDEETAKPVEVSGTLVATFNVGSDFVATKITYGPYEGTNQILAVEESSSSAIEFLIWGKSQEPGTHEIDNTGRTPEMYTYLYDDVNVLLSRKGGWGEFILKKLDKDSLVAEFEFTTSAGDTLTNGIVKLRLR